MTYDRNVQVRHGNIDDDTKHMQLKCITSIVMTLIYASVCIIYVSIHYSYSAIYIKNPMTYDVKCKQSTLRLNFNGSAGFAVILKNRNYLFVDGRYTVQARHQSGKKFKIITMPNKFLSLIHI